MIEAKNPTYAYVGAFVDELARAGVKHAVICPGSRSTPLTLTFAAEERIKKWVLVDERSAAFFALGIAKRSGEPVALVCTSGTAAANFFPAVCEAKEARIPLLVLTADRPPELQNVGAPQTMGQKYLYGEHVKWFTEMPLPEATNTVMRYARFTANRAVAESTRLPLGPIHLNFPFREPLVNKSIGTEAISLPMLRAVEEENAPFVQLESTFISSVPKEVLTQIGSAEKGLIIVGPQTGSEFRPLGLGTMSLIGIADKLKWPILADPLSGMRFGPHTHKNIVDSYDAFLRDNVFAKETAPDLILRFGAMPTSKALLLYLEMHPTCRQIVIGLQAEWLDPTLNVATFLQSHALGVWSAIRDNLDISRESTEWLRKWQNTEKTTRQVLTQHIYEFDNLFEGRVFSELSDKQFHGCSFVVGNSMPIRDCDTFLQQGPQAVQVYGNRGVNGIDGQVSTALGSSATFGEPTVLVVGDLTFYHDLNGLLAAKKYGLNLTVVVINNDGGGIFSFLPQAEHAPADHFEEYFGTAAGLDYSHITAMYGGTFTRISNWDEFRTAVTTGITEGGLHVVEVPTNRQKNVEMHRHLWRKVSEALANMKGEGEELND